GAPAPQREGRPTRAIAAGVEADKGRGSRHDVEQFAQLVRLLAVVERSDDLDRPGEPLEVGFQLGFEVVIEHGSILFVKRLANGPAVAGPLHGSSASWASRLAPGAGSAPGADLPGCWSDLADQVERRGQRLGAFLPFGGADFARMGRHVLRGLDLAQQFLGVAADAFGGDLDGLDDAVRIDDEGAAVGQALV